MNSLWYQRILAVFVCLCLAHSNAAPVLVRLGDLAWVASSEGMPRSIGGRIMVPPTAACDLLGLQCQIKPSSLDASGPLGKLSMQLHQGLTELRPLTLITGHTLHYDPRSGAATLSNTLSNTPSHTLSSGASNKAPWLALQQSLPQGNVQDIPLEADLGAPSSGHPNRQLTLSSRSSLKGLRLTLYSQGSHQQTVTGSLAPSTPDHPGGYHCQNTCTLPIPRTALWTLAYLSR